ncbi:hypothetical protein PMAYCL1PPCAC_15906, partial [Pristionchus mayeri]
MNFLLLSLLPLALAITDFANCDNDPAAGCLSDADCTVPATCSIDAAGTPPAAGAMGCCPTSATTTTTAATTAAAAATTTRFYNLPIAATCVDKLNPLTGVSDCPARASLCTNSVYLDVMRDQCPKTCNFCNSTGIGTGTNSTGTTDTTRTDFGMLFKVKAFEMLNPAN